MCSLTENFSFITPALAQFLSGIIDIPLLVGGIFLVIVLVAREKSWRFLFSFAVSMVATYAFVWLIKDTYPIARLDTALVFEASARFPSTHAALAGAFVVSLGMYLSSLIPHQWVRALMWLCGIVAVVGIALVRLLLNVHCLIDVLVGAAIGAAIAFIAALVILRQPKQK
jgi:membrane-associated phospholipid phosphatase